jgi:hypothetical protein
VAGQIHRNETETIGERAVKLLLENLSVAARTVDHHNRQTASITFGQPDIDVAYVMDVSLIIEGQEFTFSKP